MFSRKQLEDIKNLQRLCEAEDHIQLKLNWDMLHNRNNDESNDFLHYENEELAGFIGLYDFGNSVELCGMVSPNYRRKGIFSKLFTSALEEITKRKKYTRVLLNAPANSSSAKSFLQNISCTFSVSEYQMKWSETELFDYDDVTIRPSKPEDLQDEIQLDVRCFGFSENEAADFNHRVKLHNPREFYMIEHDHQAVGKIRVHHEGQEAWIYGFAIYPEYQGKGIGRKALKKIIKDEHEAGYGIFLEVEARNSNALRLYESCGFKVVQGQDYYQYK
ncbi:GNAT family N-acetyltransferase [Paenibacillus sediminis]|uniref:Ribosomal protein S18 acetylase RimI-like enzyme n=1 Tax=Paenibacillus sediminis TaxID=664909 RepID=A0ABS4GY96_9BACL|nr:GNAT family N-acetyltransferase [Paenibacillus sediminis]MBP1935234.1 ribosomal protein S18 acetylase RimI-like enzyme [Paenibacillus sediminis]